LNFLYACAFRKTILNIAHDEIDAYKNELLVFLYASIAFSGLLGRAEYSKKAPGRGL
jgi:hypothetical protein